MKTMGAPLLTLIVEDSENDALLLQRELSKAGFAPSPRRVESEAELREALEAAPWDIVLSDYSLPQFDGRRAFDIVRDFDPDLPFIIISGTIGEEVAVETMRAGVHDYLMKNNLKRLGAAVQRALQDAEVRRERRRGVERIRHLNGLLNAIRNINQLIVRERDPDRLCRQACAELVASREYRGAWLVRGAEGERPQGVAAAGWDGALDPFTDRLRAGWLPPCGAPVIAAGNGFATLEPGADCAGCPLGDKGCPRSAACVALRHGGALFGLLGVATPAGMLAGAEEEEGLLVEIGADLAFALHDIESERRRREMEAQLAQADRLSSMGMLAAGVAHEINNPLAYVLYNLESLADDLPELLAAVRRFRARMVDRLGPEIVGDVAGDADRQMNPALLNDVRARLDDAFEGARRIRDIARGLGTFSRVEKDQLVPVDLMHVIEAALNMCFNEIKYRARVVKDYGRVPTVLASEGRLSQVFLNLLINAAHAIDEGDAERNQIRVRTWAEDEAVCAEVADSGKGIAPEHQDRLFEPFFTTKEIGVGSGLGLPISKGIIEGYGGTIRVDSQPGRGTRFTIRLPLRAAPAAAARPERGETTAAVSGRLLVVDDEAGIRSALARMLRGHTIVEARTGAEARRILERDQAFDLLLCDMMMPEVSGMELHAWLAAAHPELAERLVFITGGAFTANARAYLQQVDNPRIDKPFDKAEVRKLVAERIRK
jgi:signal transduction histidine kinase/FixJ family two-component response regulator